MSWRSSTPHCVGRGIGVSVADVGGSFSMISYVIPRCEGAIRGRWTLLEDAERGCCGLLFEVEVVIAEASRC